MKVYRYEGIPDNILLEREGRIVDSDLIMLTDKSGEEHLSGIDMWKESPREAYLYYLQVLKEELDDLRNMSYHKMMREIREEIKTVTKILENLDES